MWRWLTGVAAVLVAAAAGLMLGGAVRGGAPPDTDSPLPGRAPSLSADFSLSKATAAPGPKMAIVARAKHRRVAVYERPSDREPGRRISRRTVDGQRLPVVFLVLGRRPGWVHVALPVRPNHSRGWVRAAAVRLRRDPFRVEIHLQAHRLVARKRGRVILRASIAVGKAVSPTPTGRYFITDLLRPPNPDGFFGPYAFGLSAYSPVYTSFAGGNGQIGLHGTNRPSLLGSDVSHGCIRVRNAVITRLAQRLPLGTPVLITP